MSVLTSFIERPLRTTKFEYSPRVATTARPGVAYPIITETVLAGDTFSFTPYLRVDSLPLVSPLLSTMKARLAFFYLPWRALIPRMKMDIAGLDAATIEFPQYFSGAAIISASATVNSTQYISIESAFHAPNSIGSYLYNISRYSGVYATTFTPPDGSSLGDYVNNTSLYEGFSYIMYYMVMYYYYLNRQHSRFGMFVTETNEAQVAAKEAIYPASDAQRQLRRNGLLASVSLADLEDAMMHWSMGDFKYTKGAINTVHSGNNVVNLGWYNPEYSYSPGDYVGAVAPYSSTYTSEPMRESRDLSGLVLITQTPDMTNVYVNTIAGKAQSNFSVSVQDNKVFIDDIISVNALRKFVALGAFSAAGYRDWIYAQTGLTIPADETRPVYLGSIQLGIDFNAVLATSSDGLGDLGGRSSQGMTGKHRRYTFQDYGTFMAILSIRSELAYNDNERLTSRMRTLMDVEVPVKQNVGWQPIHLSQITQGNCDSRRTFGPTGNTFLSDGPDPWTETVDSSQASTYSYMYAQKTVAPHTFTIGYQPAYTEYMSTLPRIKGHLQDTLDYWCLARVARSTTIRPTTPYMANDTASGTGVYTFNVYETPQDSQIAWVDNMPSAENFIVQVALKGTMRRIFSKQAIPTL